MNNKYSIPILFAITLALALYLTPTVAAQEEEATNALTGLWETLSGYGSQASEYVSSHVPEVAAIGTASGAAGGLGLAYKSANSAKNKLQSVCSGLSGQVTSAQQKASEVTEQLNTFKSQTETQLSTYKSQAENATGQLSGLQTQLETVAQQKTSYLNQLEETKTALAKAQAQLEVLTPKVK